MSRAILHATAFVGLTSAQEWAFQQGTTATMVLGVGTTTDDSMVAAASSNGIGAFLERYDGSALWSKDHLSVGLVMDAAVSKTVTVATSTFPISISSDGGATYVISDKIGGVSQSASIFGEGCDIGLVGSFTTSKKTESIVSGVAHSADAGVTWNIHEVPMGWVRYGSFPSKVIILYSQLQVLFSIQCLQIIY